MDKKKYLLLALTMCSIMICFCLIDETYAKYLSTADSTTIAPIARWKVLVNNHDITLGSTSSSIITPVFPGSDNISADVLAPNAEGYFDIVIDASNVDVSFSYTIQTGVNEESALTELIVTGYSVNDGEVIPVTDQKDLIKGDIDLSERNQNTTIRVFLKWDDSLNIMTNEEDTNTTKEKEAKIDVRISVLQQN